MRIVADDHIPYIQEYFASLGELILKDGRTITHADVKEADILLVRSVTKVDKQLLAQSAVRFVGSMTAGADHLDIAWLEEAGIAWGIASGFNAPPVADYVVSVIAALENKLEKKTHRAAIIGMGNIGRLVDKQLQHLNYDIIYCDPLRALSEKDFHSIPIDDIADVDFITLHVPLTRHGDHPTYHLIDKNFLQRQTKGAVLLNASRGSVINSYDLLQHGKHLNWGLDVWESEPHINKTVLQQAVIATPHIAGYSVQSKRRGIVMIYQMMQQKNILPKIQGPLLNMPEQQLIFTETKSWQAIVLAVFNPLLMTEIMRETLLAANDPSQLFDAMRNYFKDRHEFTFTQIQAVVSLNDEILLRKLGFRIMG